MSHRFDMHLIIRPSQGIEPFAVLLIPFVAGDTGIWRAACLCLMEEAGLSSSTPSSTSSCPMDPGKPETLCGSGEDGLGTLFGRQCTWAVLGHSGRGPGGRGWTSDRCRVCTAA